MTPVPTGHDMTASLTIHGRTAPPFRPAILKGVLPTTLVALALSVTLAIAHLRAIDTEALDVARIQAVRIAGTLTANMGDDRLRDVIGRTLARSAPTGRVVLHRDDGSDLVIDSGRRLSPRHQLQVRLNTPVGEMEAFSDARAAHERRIAAMFMSALLMMGVVGSFVLGVRVIERDSRITWRALRERIEHALHPRATRAAPPADERAALDALVDELSALRARHDTAMADALRLRLHDVARQTRLLEQFGDHFRQPLQALSLFVAGMQPGDDLRQRAVQGQMQHNLVRLGELLDGVLDIARFDAGAVEPESVDLLAADLFVRARTAIEPEAGRLGVDVRWRGGSMPLHTDPMLLGELLQRLLTSAVTSTPRGRVLVAFRRCGGDALLEVRDNGMGIEPDQQARLFDAFTRLPGHPSVGLGLAVARRIADTLGAEIGVRSRPGRGTLYRVRLPGSPTGLARPLATVQRFPATR